VSEPVLRAYQSDALEAIREATISSGNCLVVSPVGSGKSVLFAEIAKLGNSRGRKIGLVMSRRELVKQGSSHARRAGLVDQRIFLSGKAEGSLNAPVWVASIDTLLSSSWRDRLPEADILIVDEAHHIVTKKFVALRDAYPNSWLIGFTATPERSDGKPLKPPFTRMVVVAQVRELIEQGWLVPTTVWSPKAAQSGLADKPADAYLKKGEGRRAIIFCANIPHSTATAEALRAAGVAAEHVDGETREGERDAILARFADGTTRVLVNCNLVGEGFDVPACKCVVIARGCDSPVMWIQSIGRAMRPDDSGLSHALVLDLRGAVWNHGLPDAVREFSLDGVPISTSEKGEAIQQCRYCGHVFKPTGVCPYCGATLLIPKSPAVRRAELAIVHATHTPDQRIGFLRGLIKTARARGYKSGWVTMQFHARYKTWPSKQMLSQTQ
jgi:superfamily II DNA or RNA helicase